MRQIRLATYTIAYKVFRIILLSFLLVTDIYAQDIEAEIGGVSYNNEEVCLHDVYRQVIVQEIHCSEEELEQKEAESRVCTDAFWSTHDAQGIIRAPETPKEVQKHFWTDCMSDLSCKAFWSSCSEIAESCYETIETAEYVDEECLKVCEPVASMVYEGGAAQPWKNCRRGDREFPNCPIEYLDGSGVRNGWWIFGTDSPLLISSMTDAIPGMWGIDKRQGKIVYYAGDENNSVDNDLYLPIKEEGDIDVLYVCENAKTCEELMLDRGYDPALCQREEGR